MRAGHELLLVSSEGLGKRTDFDAFMRKHRGGQGVRALKMREGVGQVVRALTVLPDDEVMLIASSGVIIRIPVGDVSVQGPHASGVRVMSLADEERVVAVTLVRESDTADEARTAGDRSAALSEARAAYAGLGRDEDVDLDDEGDFDDEE